MADEPKRLRVKLPPVGESPPPEAANFFYFTVANTDVQLLVGYVDLRAVHEALGSETIVSPEITHRFALSPLAFKHLRQQMEDIAKKYDEVNRQDERAPGA